MSAHQSLTGRVALITGANHGIGAAVTRSLADRGCDVLVTYLRFDTDPPRLGLPDAYGVHRGRDASDVIAEVERRGARGVAVEADLTDPTVIPGLFDSAEANLGPVSILVHNASGWTKDSFADGDDGQLVTTGSADAQLMVDARAGALLMSEFIDRYRRRNDTWGRIVTMTSGTGAGYPGEVSYGAAKAALISYTLSAASEMAGDGVSANVVYPPVTDTGWVTDDVRRFVADDHEHHHIATPDEVAETVTWLCADANQLVTGNVIRLR